VNLNQALYRFIPKALTGKAVTRLESDGLPNALDYYLLYTSALIYGAADAALTLTLHNLGREARILERQVFECWVRSAYYAANPDEAKLALLSTAQQEVRQLDALGYDQGSERYSRVSKAAQTGESRSKSVRTYREPSLGSILRQPGNEALHRMYALMYKIPSQMAHASFNGTGGVLTEDGISFDSRQRLPNYGIGSVTVCLIAFLELLDKHFVLNVTDEIAGFKATWKDVERKTSES
jgi:hypothetical protein